MDKALNGKSSCDGGNLLINLTERHLTILEMLDRNQGRIEYGLLSRQMRIDLEQLNDILRELERDNIIELTTTGPGSLLKIIESVFNLWDVQKRKIIEDLKNNGGIMDYTVLGQSRIIDLDRFNRILKRLEEDCIIERRFSRAGSPSGSNHWIMLKKKSYRSYFRPVLILVFSIVVILFLVITISGPNTRTLNLLGLSFGILGALAISAGSLDHFWQIKLRGEKIISKLFKKYDNKMALMFDTGLIEYPLLRYYAAKIGQWLILIGFIFQFCAILVMSPQ